MVVERWACRSFQASLPDSDAHAANGVGKCFAFVADNFLHIIRNLQQGVCGSGSSGHNSGSSGSSSGSSSASCAASSNGGAMPGLPGARLAFRGKFCMKLCGKSACTLRSRCILSIPLPTLVLLFVPPPLNLRAQACFKPCSQPPRGH
jgi:hypothetical protein